MARGGDPGCKHKKPQKSRATRPLGLLHGGTDTVDASAGFYHDRCDRCGAVRIDEQIGLEATPDLYIEHLVDIFRAVRRTLRDDGTLWVNIGDSYSSGDRTSTTVQSLRSRGPSSPNGKHNSALVDGTAVRPPPIPGIKAKDLVGIPWMLAFALRNDGWYLRADIIWHKLNPMPESVTDRPSKGHEYIFLLSKSERYFYDAIAVRTERGANKKSVWSLASEPFGEEHFAAYPRALIVPCIQAGTSAHGCCKACGAPWGRITEEVHATPTTQQPKAINADRNDGGVGDFVGHTVKTLGWRPTCTHEADVIPCTVLDPFNGTGTTTVTAEALGRRSIGIDLSEKYLDMARRRHLSRPTI